MYIYVCIYIIGGWTASKRDAHIAAAGGMKNLHSITSHYRGTSPITKCPPPYDPPGPYAQADGRVRGGRVFL